MIRSIGASVRKKRARWPTKCKTRTPDVKMLRIAADYEELARRALTPEPPPALSRGLQIQPSGTPATTRIAM